LWFNILWLSWLVVVVVVENSLAYFSITISVNAMSLTFYIFDYCFFVTSPSLFLADPTNP